MGAEAGLGDGANYGVAGESVQGRGRARAPEGGRHMGGVQGSWCGWSRGDAGKAWEQG